MCGTWPAIEVTVAGEYKQSFCTDKKGDISHAHIDQKRKAPAGEV